jgi:hypothetical protein
METNKHGNEIKRSFMHVDRYYFDFGKCKGWKQFDTDQDASYFGVWVNEEERKTLTYAEGDITEVFCHSEESFQAELKEMSEFYGEQPPAFVAFDADGTQTNFYDTRPGEVEGQESWRKKEGV